MGAPPHAKSRNVLSVSRLALGDQLDRRFGFPVLLPDRRHAVHYGHPCADDQGGRVPDGRGHEDHVVRVEIVGVLHVPSGEVQGVVRVHHALGIRLGAGGEHEGRHAVRIRAQAEICG